MSHNWKIPPHMVVCSLVMLVVAYMAANIFVGHSARTIDPRVRMEIRSGAGEQALNETEVRRRVVVTATDGEVACTADRIGEAEALALATSLYAATQQPRGRTPRTTNDLLAGVVAESLLPPGLSLTDGDGAIASAHASLFVRYRAAPLGVEVVSLRREPRDGPAILACGVMTAFIVWNMANVFQVTLDTRIYFVFGMVICVLISLAEAASLVIPYYRIAQRLTHGSARWADGDTNSDHRLRQAE